MYYVNRATIYIMSFHIVVFTTVYAIKTSPFVNQDHSIKFRVRKLQ